MKTLFYSFTSATRALFRRWGALLIMLALYFATLGATYLFFVTREATAGQLILSLLLALAAPIMFLIIQTMAARYTQEGSRAGGLLVGSLRDFWKLLVVSLPLILLAVLAIYLFAKPEAPTAVTAVREAAREAPAVPRPVAQKPQPISWGDVAISTVQYLLFCLILPLAAIHLWIAAANDGLVQTLKRSPRILARAFAPRSVVIYVIGFIFFAVLPYFLVVTRTPVTNAWLDAGLLVGRLALAALFSLIGWVVTVGALSRRGEANQINIAQQHKGPGHVPAEA